MTLLDPMTIEDDDQLLRTYTGAPDSAQRQTAFGELVRRHLDWVYSVARRQVGDAHLAEDVAQAVFVLLARKAATLGDGVAVRGWLFRATRYACRDAIKMRARRRHHEHEAAAMATVTRRAEQADDAAERETNERLDEAVHRLAAADRDALILRFYQGLTTREIGQRLRITEDAAKKRVTRAVDRLRSAITGTTTSTSAPALERSLAGLTIAAPVGLLETVIATGASATVSSGVAALATATAAAMTAGKAQLIAAAVAVAVTFVAGTAGVAVWINAGGPKVAQPATAPVVTAPAPVAAAPATRPAGAHRMVEAMHAARTVHIRARGGDQWFDRERGVAMIDPDRGQARGEGNPSLRVIDDGRFRYQRRGDRPIARSRSAGDTGRHLGWVTRSLAELWAQPPRREPAGDRVIDGVPCELHVFDRSATDVPAGTPVRLWLDPAGRPVRGVEGEADETAAELTYDAALPADRFELRSLGEAPVVDVDAWLAERYPLDRAVQRIDALGLHLTVHDVRTTGDGLVFVTLVTRLGEEVYRSGRPPIYDMDLSNHCAEPHPVGGDEATHTVYRLGVGRSSGWVVVHVALIPKPGVDATANRCSIGVHLNPGWQHVHEWLTARGMPEKQDVRLAFDLPAAAGQTSLADAARGIYRVAAEMDPLTHAYMLVTEQRIDERTSSQDLLPPSKVTEQAYVENVGDAIDRRWR